MCLYCFYFRTSICRSLFIASLLPHAIGWQVLQCKELSLPLLAKVILHPCNADTFNEFLSPRPQGKFLRLEEVSIRNPAEQNLLGEKISSGKWSHIITAMLCKIKLILLKFRLGKKKGKQCGKISQTFQFLLLKLLFLWGILEIVSYILQGKVNWFCWSRTFWWI